MNCLEFQTWLQDRLDGVAQTLPPDGLRHVTACAECRERHDAIVRLERGLRLLPKVEPAPLLTQSIVTAVLEDHHRRTRLARRMTIGLSMAASILLAVVAGWLWITRGDPTPPVVDNKPTLPKPPNPEVAELSRSADEARQAVASLTERVADQTKEQGKLLLSMANNLDLPPMAGLPSLNVLEEPLDPAAKSLRQASDTVATGMEPIARTARQAFGFFAREMPMFEIPLKN